MLNWISSKLKQEKVDHPLASEAGIREFLADLTPGKPETPLAELTDWLREPEQLAMLSPEAVLRAIAQLDEHARELKDRIWESLLVEKRVDHLVEQQLRGLEAYYDAALVANNRALTVLAERPDAAGDNLPGLTGLFAQRAMAALLGRLRTQRIRYRAPDATWWAAAGALLQRTRSANVINLKQRTYPSDATPSSTWLEYLIAQMFEISPVGNFNAQQMDLLYRILRWLEPNFMVQDSFSSQSPFHTRLDKGVAPERTNAALPPDPMRVYFGPGLAYGQLIRLRASIVKAGSLPDWLGRTHCPTDKGLAVIEGLVMHWSERPPERQHAREAVEAALKVTHGFAQMRRMVAFSEFARSGRKVGYKTHLEMLKFERFGFADSTGGSQIEQERWQNATPLETLQILETSGDRQMMDDWSLADVSAGGFGAVVPFLKPWIAVGTYLACRADGELNWKIGILRRIHRTKSGHPSVGVQTFGDDVPRCAQIKSLGGGSDPWAQMTKETSGQGAQDALVVSMSAQTILLPPGTFEPGRLMVLIMGGNRAPIRLKSRIQHNDDCDCVQYELCDQAAP